MADDMDLTTANDDAMSNDTGDDDILLSPERDVSDKPEDNELVIAEKEAIADDEFDEPLAVQTDPGVVNEANHMPAELWEEGTDTDNDAEVFGDFGMHVKEMADETNTEEDDDSLDTLNNQME